MFDAVDKNEVGERIKKARLDCKISSTRALAKLIHKEEGKKTTLTRPTVDNWETGKQIPPWDRISQLAAVFKEHGHPEYGEQWILFGETGQKYLIENVSPEEAKLLMAFRRSNQDGKRLLLNDAESLADKYPEERGKVHRLRPVNNNR